ncbi:MAG: hypothetical protein EOO02_02645 [Chitinophagaceae bacterium]|nr:MAG: hypothetical protein EOO02_02645 [Chitinophagaceae bacterium]
MKSCLLFLSTISFLNSFSQNTALTFNGTTQYATIGLTGPTSNFVNPAISLIALPVVYKSFTARVDGNDALLQWTTAQEQNSRDFTIEHSIDGINFKPITKLDAAGTTTRETNYVYKHETPIKGANYYRLVQNDLDGKSSISEVRKLVIDGSNRSMVLLGNIATNGQLQMQINRKTPVSLYTMDGKLLFRRQFNPGTHRLELAGYSKGMYWLSAEGSTEKIMIR